MKIRYVLIASAFVMLASCKDRNEPIAPGEPLNDTVTVVPPEAPPVPEAGENDRNVEVKTPDGKVEVSVPAPPPPPKPGQLPPPPPPPPKIKIK